MMNQARRDAEVHALRDYPREACGFIVRTDAGDVYVPVRNAAITKSEHFVIPAKELARAEDVGELITLVHSHPDIPAIPTQADRVSCEASGLEWLILSVFADEPQGLRIAGDCVFKPSGYQAPLLGRQFVFGVLDCYTLIRDWYKREQGVDLPNFERRDNFWKEGPDQTDLYAQYEHAGFVEVKDAPLEVGDVLLIQLRSSKFANHAAVYIGDGMILHHMYSQLSRRDVYGFAWKEKTRRIVRRQ